MKITSSFIATVLGMALTTSALPTPHTPHAIDERSLLGGVSARDRINRQETEAEWIGEQEAAASAYVSNHGQTNPGTICQRRSLLPDLISRQETEVECISEQEVAASASVSNGGQTNPAITGQRRSLFGDAASDA